MDFTLSNEVEEYREAVRNFVDKEIIPLEADKSNYDHHENIALKVLKATQDKVKAAGLWAPQMPKDRGGLGFNQIGMAASYEEMNRSILVLYVLTARPLMMVICLYLTVSQPKIRKTNGFSLSLMAGFDLRS
jgi:alkylation response protein AidB-like acyl-CoA dehydrogenase